MEQIKPDNCTCRYPEVVIRNMNGHDPSCPVYQAWYETWHPVKCERCSQPLITNVNGWYKIEGKTYCDACGDKIISANTHMQLAIDEHGNEQAVVTTIDHTKNETQKDLLQSPSDIEMLVDRFLSSTPNRLNRKYVMQEFVDWWKKNCLCHHPWTDPLRQPHPAFVSQKSYDNLINANITSVLGSPLVVDESIIDSLVHFVNPSDGTCAKYSV